MSELLAGWIPAVDALGWTLLHFLWQGAAIAALYALARPWLPSGRVRYAGALSALALLLSAPVITLVRLLPLAAEKAATVVAGASALSADVVTTDANAEQWLPWLVGLWAMGVVVLTVRALLHWHGLLRLMRRATALPQWEDRLTALRQRFGIRRVVRLLWSEEVDTPTLVGWLRPVILLPAAVALGFPAAQLELILAHELGHVRRWDYLVNLIQVVVETVLFYHPAVHWISRELRHEREICCDELVLHVTRSHPHLYARTLASLEQLRSDERLALAVAASGGVLLDRVQRVVGVEPATSQLAARPVARLLPLALAGVVLVAGVVQQQAWRERLIFMPWQLAHVLTLNVTAPKLNIADLAQQPSWTRPHLIVGTQTVESPAGLPAAAPEGVSPVPSASIAPPLMAAPIAPAPIADLPADAGSQVAVATTAPATTAAPTAELAVLRAPQPVKMVHPVYPDNALQRGVEGIVTVEFELGVNGDVLSTRVVSAQPERVFDAAALQALRWWRYDPATIRPGARYQQNFVFSLAGSRLPKLANTEAVNAENECRVVTGSRLCRHPDGSEQSQRPHGVDMVDMH